MAYSKQARKRLRQAERRSAVNKSRRSRVRTFVRKVEDALLSGDKEAAVEALKMAEPALTRSGQQGILSRNAAG